MSEKTAKPVSILTPHGTDPGDAEKARREDYRRLFASTLGRRVLADILNEGGLFRPHLRFDDRSLAVLEGRRSLALDIFALAGGAKERLGRAMAGDNIGEALNVPDATSDAGDAGAEPVADPDADPGERGDALFARYNPGADLIDGD